MKREKLHNHPHLEKKLGLDENHVIIDRPTFERLMQKEQPQPGRSVPKGEYKNPYCRLDLLEFNCGYELSCTQCSNFIENPELNERLHSTPIEQPQPEINIEFFRTNILRHLPNPEDMKALRDWLNGYIEPQPERSAENPLICSLGNTPIRINFFDNEKEDVTLEFNGEPIAYIKTKMSANFFNGILEEYRSQGLPEVTDEMINEYSIRQIKDAFNKLLPNEGDYMPFDADLVLAMRNCLRIGAEDMRDGKIKQTTGK